MECIPIGEKIITVSVQTHGTIIDLNLSPEMHSLFHKTRLFSFAGIYQSAYYSNAYAKRFMKKMEHAFARDIDGKSMVQQLDEYIIPLREEYKETLTPRDPISPENVCNHIGAITIDKAFAKEEENFIQRCIHYLVPDLENIYVISVHEKIGRNKYKLLTSPKDAHTSILDLSFFQKQGRNDIVDLILRESTEFPNMAEAKMRIKSIENNSRITNEEKETQIKEIKNRIYDELQQWKCSMNTDRTKMTSIRMSFLTKILQMLYGDNCRIQYMDYSCNEVSIFVPEDQYAYKQYHMFMDIEQGIAGGIAGGIGKGIGKGITGGKTKRRFKPKRKTITRNKKIKIHKDTRQIHKDI